MISGSEQKIILKLAYFKNLSALNIKYINLNDFFAPTPKSSLKYYMKEK